MEQAAELREYLPRHWAKALSPEVASLVVDETHLNCRTCALKCCDYWPFIPNFIVGGLLSRPWFESCFQAWISAERVVLPLGIVPEVSFQLQHRNPKQRLTLRCPLLLTTGDCSIFESRPAQCTTYFCRSRAGQSSPDFWGSLLDFGNYFEQGLASQWMVEAGYRWSEVEANRDLLVAGAGVQDVTSSQWREHWAHHGGNLREYFVRAWEWYAALTQDEVREMLGPQGLELERRAWELHSLTSNQGSPRANP